MSVRKRIETNIFLLLDQKIKIVTDHFLSIYFFPYSGWKRLFRRSSAATRWIFLESPCPPRTSDMWGVTSRPEAALSYLWIWALPSCGMKGCGSCCLFWAFCPNSPRWRWTETVWLCLSWRTWPSSWRTRTVSRVWPGSISATMWTYSPCPR